MLLCDVQGYGECKPNGKNQHIICHSEYCPQCDIYLWPPGHACDGRGWRSCGNTCFPLHRIAVFHCIFAAQKDSWLELNPHFLL